MDTIRHAVEARDIDALTAVVAAASDGSVTLVSEEQTKEAAEAQVCNSMLSSIQALGHLEFCTYIFVTALWRVHIFFKNIHFSVRLYSHTQQIVHNSIFRVWHPHMPLSISLSNQLAVSARASDRAPRASGRCRRRRRR